MKKIILGITLFVGGLVFAQEQPGSIVAVFEADQALKAGVSFEIPTDKKFLNRSLGTFLQLQYTSLTATRTFNDGITPDINHSSNGIGVGVGFKWYLQKNKNFRGWNIQDGLFATYNWFSNNDFNGKIYTISFINPMIGYKFKSGHFTIEPQAGFNWDIVTKKDGDISKLDYGNSSVKVGLRIGYID